MPERDKSVARIAVRLVGAKAFDGLSGDVRRPAIQARFWRGLQAVLDELWTSEVRQIDWNRVILHAHNQHVALVQEDSSHGIDSEHQGGRPLLGLEPGDDQDTICSQCLVNSLLTLSTGGPTPDDPDHDHDADQVWRAEWIKEGGGVFAIWQAILPHLMKVAHDADAQPYSRWRK